MDTVFLQWDTDFFEKKVARINIYPGDEVDIDAMLDDARQQGYKLVYIFADSTNHSMAEKLVQKIGPAINRKVIFNKTDLRAAGIVSRPNDDFVITNTAATILPEDFNSQVLALTLKAGALSRFRLDEKLDADSFTKMYNIWTEAMLHHSDYRIIVAQQKDDSAHAIAGYLSYKIIDGGYKIDFMSIEEAFKSQGLGKLLVKKMAEEIDYDNYIVTEIHEENTGAFKFFSSLGFTIRQSLHIYHVHL